MTTQNNPLATAFTHCYQSLDRPEQLQRATEFFLRRLDKTHNLFRQIDSFLYRKFPKIAVQIREEGRQEALFRFFEKLPRFFHWLDKVGVTAHSEVFPHTCIAYLKNIAFRKTVDILRREKHHYSLDVQLGEDGTETFLDHLMDESENSWQWLQTQEEQDTIQAIIDDPEGKFSTIRSRKYPACTLPRLVQEISTGATFQEIGDRLEMPLGTLTAFWYRHCRVA